MIKCLTKVLLWSFIVIFACAANAEEVELTLLSHRHPTYEIYASQLDSAIEGVRVQAMLMPVNQCMELARLAMAAGYPVPYDIVWANDILIDEYASKGWLVPLDDYVAKYWDVYDFGDIPEAVWEGVKYQGHIYALPTLNNVMFFFYRKDLFDKYELTPPQTFDEYLEAARVIQENEGIYGTTLTLKPGDTLGNEFHSYLSAYGGSWFDDRGYPAFNSPAGIQAVETIKALMRYAPPGVLTYANDESAAALQMGLVGMGIQWFTRAATMDDPSISQVVGLIQFTVPPSSSPGGIPASRLATDGYVIPKGTTHDPELIFKVIAQGTLDQSTVVQYCYPPRRKFVTDNVIAEARWYKAAFDTIAAGAKVQAQDIGIFMQINEIVTYRVSQALAGELTTEDALNLAAQEAQDLLRKEGIISE